jgi:hypothetical protein
MKCYVYQKLFSFILLSFLATICLADGDIVSLLTPQDHIILDEFDSRRIAAIEAARKTADQKQLTTLNKALTGTLRSFDDGYDPSGTWKCRYLKLGPEQQLTIYDWYNCKIFDGGAGWVLKKTSGSQLFMGRLYRLNHERLLYLGSLHYAYEAPIKFGANMQRKQIAVLTSLMDGRLRLEFPAPLFESNFDIVELAPIDSPYFNEAQ